MAFNPAAFIVQIGTSYLLGRLTAQDGQKLTNLQAASGDYGVPMPRLYGGAVRAAGVVLAQAEIKETKHKVQDYSELAGALTGAAQGFMMGGPVGALIGGAIGGLLGAVTPNQYYYTYSATFALLFADRTGDDPIEGLTKLWANGKVIFNAAETTIVSETLDGGRLVRRKYGKNRYIKSLTVYGGGKVQVADPVLTAAIGEQPGYRGLAYAVIEDLQLADFGQAVPPIEGLVAAKSGQTLASFAEAVCAAAGLDRHRSISTTALTGQVLGGYAVTGETSCWDALRPILPVYKVDVSEAGGQMRFFRREQGLRGTIPAKDMAGHAFGDERPAEIRFARSNDPDLPRETSLTFVDPARDYQANTASSKRSEGSAKSNISLKLALTLTADQGATAAATIHWDAWLGRTGASFTLTDKWIGLTPGLAYGIRLQGAVLAYRATRRTRGPNGIIEVEAVSDESVLYQGVVTGSSGYIPPEEPTVFPDTRIVLMDMPILEDSHDDFGFYAVMAGTAPYWTRGRIEASSNGADYATMLDSDAGALLGDVVGVLAAGTTDGLDDSLDETSVLNVELAHDGMVLSSATDALLDAWANFAFVGKNGRGEYLQFKNAVKTAPRTWQLTGLRRGRKGTDHAIAGHGAGEEFALLGGPGVFRIVYTADTQWGVPLSFRGVTLHQEASAAAIVAFTNSGEGKRPYSPIDVQGTWDGSNNLTITFEDRSRMNAGGLGAHDRDEYVLEILSGAGRTFTVTDELVEYPEADQLADGVSPAGVVTGRVKQTSDVNDGRWRYFSLIGPGAALLLLEDDVTAFHLEDATTPIELG